MFLSVINEIFDVKNIKERFVQDGKNEKKSICFIYVLDQFVSEMNLCKHINLSIEKLD